MAVSDMGDFEIQSILDSNLLINPDDLTAQASSSSFDEIYPFDLPGGDLANATFDFDGFDFDQQAIQGEDSGFAVPTTPQSSFPEQRYVSFPSHSQIHHSSVWRPLKQPVPQLHYPDPEIFSQPPIDPTPYYPLQPLPLTNTTTTQHNFTAITPPGQQSSSIDRSLFLHGNMNPPQAPATLFHFEPIPNYPDNGSFNPEDLALSTITEDLVAAGINEEWALTDDLYIPDPSNENINAEAPGSDGEYEASSSARAKRPRRNRSSKPKAVLPNGEVKKGRPCEKPQTEERRRVNERRMEGYYRRKYEQGNLEKARAQSKESYWRRKQRRIEKGEKVRSYNPGKRGKEV